ncbi:MULTISPECIES: M81 family metallopeptidase [unclassified Roseitalea]|uniref:M81 family metallopeptidase n=1 Tax=unclassified Roseitalea TaxID=2639107 RepID=UPI002740004F|nr:MULTISPECIES: M81 family metallopeptidase [unclassified Roseitalea]
MRIALIHIAQETNDFNPVPTTLEDYRAFGIEKGDEMLSNAAAESAVAGYLDAVRDSGRDVETVPIIRAFAVAGGRVTQQAFDFFAESIRAGLQTAGPVDGLALQLHGACAAEHLDDVEGAQAKLCRSILGPHVPIVAAIDHHANVTNQLIAHCDAIVGHRTQPHDVHDTGRIGAQVLLRIAAGEVKPVMTWRKIPLLSHQEQFLTSQGPMKTWFDRARQMETDPRVIQASNYPMQPWLDVDEGGWSTVVVTDGDAALADALAEELADLAWSMRDAFQRREAISVDDAVRRADAAQKGMVVISDTGDTVFGGAAGDSNVILESMLRLGINSRALIPLISAQAVATLAQAGEGAWVTLALGGDSAPEFFTPLEVAGRVRLLADGHHVPVAFNHQSHIDMGRVAVFDVGPVTLLISEKRGVAGNLPDVYRAFGITPEDYKIAVLKTASNFQFFAPLTAQVIRADTPGPGQSDVHTLPWRRIPRPVYPLDPVDDWRAFDARVRGLEAEGSNPA